MTQVNDLHRLYNLLSYILLLICPVSAKTFEKAIRGFRSFSSTNIIYKSAIGRLISFFYSGKLAQQYVCEQCVKVERFLMKWCGENQTHIIAEKYSELILDAADSEDLFLPENRIVSPPTHYASSRWYVNSFQAAMALVREYGKPNLFIAMTCSPNWPEILGSLLPGQQASDRPDLWYEFSIRRSVN